ncbi:MAG: DUF2975 domain-containing protein [Oscillospiraceae bacterium]|nr:DUF2975 domain-containing protein [Oscillospiraceae bacterium]
MNNTKLIKSTARIDRLMKILRGFMIAAEVVCGIFIVLTLIFGDKVVADSSSLSMGPVTVQLYETAVPQFADLRMFIIIALAIGMVGAGAGLYMVKVVRSILEPMKEGRPFEHGISSKIRTMGWAVIICGAVCEVLRAAAAFVEFSAYDVYSVFNSAMVKAVNIDYKLDFNFVIIGLVIFLLAHIFSYGEQLQQEADETL